MQWPTRPAGPHGAGPAMGTALIKAAVQCPCVATQTPRQAVTGRDRSGRAQHAGGRVLGTSTSGSRLGECSAAQRLTPHSRSPTPEFITNRRPAQALQKTCGKPIAALFVAVPSGRSPRRPSPAEEELGPQGPRATRGRGRVNNPSGAERRRRPSYRVEAAGTGENVRHDPT